MVWTLRYRGLNRVWKEVTVEAETRDGARRKLEVLGFGCVFTWATRDVQLMDETGCNVLHSAEVRVNNFPRAKARS